MIEYREVHKFLSVEDREYFIEQHTTHREEKIIRITNICLNAICALFVWCIWKFNITMWAISFILFDIALIFLEQLLFITVPYIFSKNSPLPFATWRLHFLKKKANRMLRTEERLRKRKCKDCRYIHKEENCIRCDSIANVRNKRLNLLERVEKESMALEKTLEQKICESTTVNRKTSSDYDDKITYLSDIERKLKYYCSNSGGEYLMPIIKVLEDLMLILNEKPSCISLIPSSTYVYLDEVIAIHNRVIQLDAQRAKQYNSDMNIVVSKLSNNINNLVQRIERMETEDINVSIAVLLQELNDGEE